MSGRPCGSRAGAATDGDEFCLVPFEIGDVDSISEEPSIAKHGFRDGEPPTVDRIGLKRPGDRYGTERLLGRMSRRNCSTSPQSILTPKPCAKLCLSRSAKATVRGQSTQERALEDSFHQTSRSDPS